MGKINIALCPETGICSILKSDGSKIDLTPGEVGELRKIIKDPNAVKLALEDVDPAFAKSLDAQELAQLAKEIK